jgi:hypothetical protein
MNCRYCYGNGHNIRTCPKIREQAAKHPDSWAARKVESLKSSTSSTGNSNTRVCGYCKQSGHNRKTCKKILVDFADAVSKNSQYRMKMLENMKMCGFGVGTLVDHRYSTTGPVLITRIDWDKINISGLYGSTNSVYFEDEYNCYPITLDKFDIIQKTYKDYYFETCSGIDPQLVALQVPTGWITGASRVLKDHYGIK